MKKNELIELISKDICSKNMIETSNSTLSNITTNLQGAGPSDIVFYKAGLDEKAIEVFNSRLASSNPGIVILNHKSESFVKNKNCLFIEESRFLNVQKILLDILYPFKNKMKIIGVTGTNGKTTTVNLAMQISTNLKHPAISIGTIGVMDSSSQLIEDLGSTTPSYVEFRKLINKFQDNYEACFVEVSSHALVQGRLHDISLDGAGWTSFSQDHLDYHKTMDEYFNAKLLIEKKYLKDGKHLIIPKSEKDLFERILKSDANTKVVLAKTLQERKILDLPLFYHSLYNQSNVEVALQLNEDLWGVDKIENIDLHKIETPKGRFSVIELESNQIVIIDYAHTPDALINIGGAIKKAFPKHSLTVVFGCGGNRDKTKRPLMGKAVSQFADKIIVTSDNPREEAPEDIVMEIINGIKCGYEAVIDREAAIEYALESMTNFEVVLIAGKGHEEYQEVKGIKHAFSDFNIVKNFKHG
jgi:UDP-N-acetylmuramoyl-L-alanyl-D-glutamate--2,6-diaminopimelate ligase